MADEVKLPTLPQDIIVDILSRLPVRSLTRFKCVSPSWNSVIRSRKFIEMHLRKSSDIDEETRKLRILMSALPGWSLACEYLDDTDPDIANHVILDLASSSRVFSDRYLGADLQVLGSCNGLVCLHFDATYLVWNPSSGVFHEIHEADVPTVYDMPLKSAFGKSECYLHGFGYDSKIDDYKIVRVAGVDWPGGNGEGAIFTLGSNSCRKFRDRIMGEIPEDTGVFANGALHWLEHVQLCEDGRYVGEQNRILSFQLEKEKFEDVLPLPDVDWRTISMSNLTVLDGQLSMLIRHIKWDANGSAAWKSVGEFELWSMAEYGVQTSWTKKLSLPYGPGPYHRQWLWPICFSKKGALLVDVDGRRILMYDPNENTTREVHVPGLFEGQRKVMCRMVYVESLVSPLINFGDTNWRNKETGDW